jgi:DNA-binding response OmpR family regulator
LGIPVARSDREASMSHAAYASRVLVVDDHPALAELVAIHIRRGGMEPVTCLGGRQALDALAAESFDAVILDVMMPDVTGYDVLAHIRSTPATAILPVILLTAKAMPEDIERGLLLGANSYVVKPFKGRDLVNRVRLSIEEMRLGGRVATLR